MEWNSLSYINMSVVQLNSSSIWYFSNYYIQINFNNFNFLFSTPFGMNSHLLVKFENNFHSTGVNRGYGGWA